MILTKIPKFIENTAITSIFRLVQLALGVGASIIVARSLGPVGKGIYSLAFLFYSTMVNFLDFGIGRATIYHIGRKKFLPKEILGINIVFSSLIGLISIILGAIIIVFMGKAIFPGVSEKYLFLALMLVPLYLFLNYITSIFLGLQKIKTYNFFQVLLPLIFLIILAIALLFGKISIETALFAQIVAYLVSITAAFFNAKKIFCGIVFTQKTVAYKDTISYSVKSYLGNIITFFQYRANVFLINIFLNPLAVGFYSVAIALAEQIWIISEAAGAMLFPRVASETDEKKLKEFTPRVCRNVLFITLAMCAALFFVGPWLITLLYSTRFSESIEPFKILLIGIIAMSGWRILSSDLYGRGMPMINTYISSVSVVVSIVLNILLIPKFGIVGAAWATSLSYMANFTIIVLVYRKISGNRIRNTVLVNVSDIKYYFKMFSDITARYWPMPKK